MKQYLDADDLFLITKQGFDFFHEQFGVRYPLPKYDQLWVPDFNAGAMENFGCVTHAESALHLPVARSPTSSTSSGPTRSCTRWPTCGSATWSPCAGGTTCG